MVSFHGYICPVLAVDTFVFIEKQIRQFFNKCGLICSESFDEIRTFVYTDIT